MGGLRNRGLGQLSPKVDRKGEFDSAQLYSGVEVREISNSAQYTPRNPLFACPVDLQTCQFVPNNQIRQAYNQNNPFEEFSVSADNANRSLLAWFSNLI